jgi:hypothetical protein
MPDQSRPGIGILTEAQKNAIVFIQNMFMTLAKDTYASNVRASIKTIVFICVLLLGGLFLSTSNAQAASKKGFEAFLISAPKTGFTIAPGEEKQVMISFQNRGEKTWVNSGAGFVSVYTYGPKYRASSFKASDWVDFTQAAVLKETSVASKAVGNIFLTLKAPKSEGTYKETFNLAAENVAWIPGGEFTLTIKVEKATGNREQGTVSSGQGATTEKKLSDGQASPETDGLSAMVLVRSAKTVMAKAGEAIKYKVGVKNTGTASWIKREVVVPEISIATDNETRNASWVSATQLVINEKGTVKPGGLDFLEFSFNAPSTKGTHTVRYRMSVDNEVIPDFYIDIPVEVTTGAPAIKDEPVSVEEGDVELGNFIDEPVLRIGVLIVDQETDWQIEVACDKDWKLVDGDGAILGEIKKGDMVRAFYQKQKYYFNRGNGIEETQKYLRFVPDSTDAVFKVENFDRRRTRGAAYAFNQFRDTLELRYNAENDRTWLINELPVEEYLYGLGETSNASHQEFKKALITVARTYAMYHFERATKHADEYFHMNSYADDQVYFGYQYETIHPLIKQAVEDTRGVTVNYNGSTALTPYFSRSDGRTRAWSEVWGGDVAWLKGVPAPDDKKKGYKLWGHGVGMSATEALSMANNGSDWEEIIEYFYQGVELNKRWE